MCRERGGRLKDRQGWHLAPGSNPSLTVAGFVALSVARGDMV